MTRPAPWLACAATIAVPRARFPWLPRTAYAVIVAGGGLAPAYRDGETLIVDPLRLPRDGDVVVIWPPRRLPPTSHPTSGHAPLLPGTMAEAPAISAQKSGQKGRLRDGRGVWFALLETGALPIELHS
jgi:hypothetical protein